ncbi:MAG: hypothetical protein OH319_03410 [Candidatus Parvarchaeota archaeon]|nr:hypothetical protein [Candidatus Jingweiarchaeum tengchongense]MCW1298541.1 hypothetical protein [Candidatus Jingweiarchaeum tengchongense]MCW1304553.1 hypothetical protein [Candidatus Jingweiarchaeum tengchongense]MCW1305719.1 hypothetical protein [Candidatus Jingweiarchaeum tengchongense]MCW1310225.1 hypothetical protein [Candidatus Jingweiarchaeum tengchongense]
MKRILFFLLIAILIIHISYAITYYVTPIKQEGNPGEILSYNITIFNNDSFTRNLQFTFLDWPLSSFSPSHLMTLEPGETKSVVLNIVIPTNTIPNLKYYLNTFVSDYSKKDVTVKIPIIANVILSSLGKINVTQIVAPAQIDPRYEFDVKVGIMNVFEIRNITLILNIYNTTDPLTPPIYSSRIDRPINTGNMTIVFSRIKLTDDQVPGTYFIKTELYDGSTMISNLTGEFEVVGYSDISYEIEEKTTLFEKSVIFKFYNKGTRESGNVIHTQAVPSLDLILLKKIEGNGEKVGNGIRWVYNVAPKSTVEIGYTVSYVPVVIFPFIVLALIYVVYYVNRKIIVEKEIIEVHKVDHAFSFKILLKVKNVSFGAFREIVIQEPVPAFISSVGGFGTIEARIVKKGAHKNLVWEVNELKAGEELTISYKMKTKLHILGKINLPCARVKFVDNKGKRHEKKSNTLSFEVLSKV